MYKTVQTCNNCGADLTLDDMRQPNCPYCHVVYPHHSQAAQHAQLASQVMNNMLAQQAQIQNQWRSAFGVGPQPPMTPGPYGTPYDPNAMVQAHMAAANSLGRTITLIVVISTVGIMVLVGAIIALQLVF